MKGAGVHRIGALIAGALTFTLQALAGRDRRLAAQAAAVEHGHALPTPSSGAYNYRGGGGVRANQRAAIKRRNVKRHRAHCRS